MEKSVKTTFTVDPEKMQVVMTRVFDAPVELVFKTMSDPTLIPKWWGPSRYTTTVDKFEFKVGGKWRYIQRDKDGNEFAFNGEYKEIIPNKKISDTFEYELMAGHILVETAVLEEVEGGLPTLGASYGKASKTRMTTTSQFASKEDLEGMIGSGMEGGSRETWERFAELVEKV